MPVLNDSSYQMCLPINFGAVKSTPSTCVDAVLAAADKAAADKAAADKKLVTCVKGKVVKKVVANGKCPSGYKKK